MKNGILLVDKEAGCTSHDVVQKIRRLAGQKKVGHCGTLDPDATGLLVLTLGRGTRLTRFLINAPKVYEGTVTFGASTDTYDASGTVTREALDGAVAALRLADVEEAMARFVGTLEQAPPPFSAKKIKGVKYYELARRGQAVPTEGKEVTVFEFHPLSDLEEGRIRFRMSCTSGTYARSLANDTGDALGCGAHLSALRRLQVGTFRLDDAMTLDELATALEESVEGEFPEPAWVPFDAVPLPFGEVVTDPQQEQRIAHGQTVLIRDLAGDEGDWIKLINARRQFVAVGTVLEKIGSGGVGLIQPRVVFK